MLSFCRYDHVEFFFVAKNSEWQIEMMFYFKISRSFAIFQANEADRYWEMSSDNNIYEIFGLCDPMEISAKGDHDMPPVNQSRIFYFWNALTLGFYSKPPAILTSKANDITCFDCVFDSCRSQQTPASLMLVKCLFTLIFAYSLSTIR